MTAALTVLVFLLFLPAAPAFAQVGTGELDEAIGQLGTLSTALEGISVSGPGEYWDFDELTFDLAFEEPETIVAWVNENVAFQPYVGVLRGADGALASRSGNAWDQALVTTALLSDAGYLVRVARTRIGEEEAQDLVMNMRLSRFPAGAASDPAEYAELVGAEMDAFEALATQTEELVRERVEASSRAAETLRTALSEAGLGLSDLNEDLTAELVEEARDYVWVEYRLHEDEPWAPAHPAAPAEAAWLSELEAAETFEETIPDEVQHRFRFQAMVERRADGELEVNPVMAAWERPVAHIGGTVLTYASVPDGLLETDVSGDSPEDAFAATSLILPILNGALAPDAEFFDLLGNTVPAMAAASPASGLFGTLSQTLADATSAVSGKDEVVALTAHWLEFTFIAPGGEEVTHRRYVMDRLGTERREAGDGSGPLEPMSKEEQYAALAESHSFMLAPGEFPAGYVNWRATSALKTLYAYADVLYGTVSAESGEEVLPPAEVIEQLQAVDLLRAFQAFDERLDAADDSVLHYRAAPSLLAVRQSWLGTGSSTDIIANEKRAVLLHPGELPEPAPAAALEAGVWESTAEAFLLGSPLDTVDTVDYFTAVTEAGIPLLVLPADSETDVAELDLPAEAAAAARRDLSAGYAVVLPEVQPDGFDSAYWWRVNTATGETLGRGGDGRGVSATEYAALQTSISTYVISAVFGGAGYGLCLGMGGDFHCCILDAVASGMVGYTVGLQLAVMEASAAVTILVSAGTDFVGFNLGAAGLIPSFCAEASAASGPELAAAGQCSIGLPAVVMIDAPRFIPDVVPVGRHS